MNLPPSNVAWNVKRANGIFIAVVSTVGVGVMDTAIGRDTIVEAKLKGGVRIESIAVCCEVRVRTGQIRIVKALSKAWQNS